MEVAPSVAESSCDSPIFNARTEADYRNAFHQAGLRLVTISGVDPAPFKTLFLPYYKRLPRSWPIWNVDTDCLVLSHRLFSWPAIGEAIMAQGIRIGTC